MPVTRRVLEVVLAALKRRNSFRLDDPEPNRPHDALDVFPAIDDAALPGFSPAVEGQVGAFLLWSRTADAAFADDGLVRPIVLFWGGDAIDLQMGFATAGLTVRIERDPTPRRGFPASGTVVLAPDADAQRCHLVELRAAFTRLRERGVIALANAGYTQSDGWSDVAEHGPDSRPAVFWQAQGHERAFDGEGALVGALHLYWRGELERITPPLTQAGFVVERPASPEHSIVVSAGPPRDIVLPRAAELVAPALITPAPVRATARGAMAVLACFETPEVKPFIALSFSPQRSDRLLAVQGQDLRGFPEQSLRIFDLPGGDVLHTIDDLWLPTSAHPLADGRVLLAHYESENQESFLCVRQWRPGGEPTWLFALPLSHVGSLAQTAVDADGQLLTIALDTAISVRHIGPEDAPAPAARPRNAPIRRRPTGAAAAPLPEPGAWQELAHIELGQRLAYPMVALSSDARSLLWTGTGGEIVKFVERDGGRVRWTTAPFVDHSGGRKLTQIGFTPGDTHVALLRTKSSVGRKDPDGTHTTQERRELLLHRISDGARDLPALESACAGLHAFAAGPRGLWAVADDQASVTLMRFPELTPLATAEVPHEVTALAFDRSGARLAAGTSKGELVVLELRGR